MFLILIMSVGFAQTYTYKCADPDTAMSPVTEVKVDFDKKSGLYTYKYIIKNKSDALVPIRRIYLITFSNGADIKSNENWKFNRFDDNELFWSSKSEGSYINYKYVNGELTGPEGNSYDIWPGKSADGFEFKSKYPPGPVKIEFGGTALNQYGIAGPDGKLLENPEKVLSEFQIQEFEKQIINCPGYINIDLEVDPSRDFQSVSDVTIGPIPPERVTAKLRMRKINEKKWRGSCDTEPDNEVLPIDTGKIQVMLFGSRELDVTKIDLNSLRFGPGVAKPTKTAIVNEFRDKDGEVDNDIQEHLKKNNAQHLLMEFNLDDVDIRCGGDRALFLDGKIAGKSLFGAVKIKHGSCLDKKNNAKQLKKIKDYQLEMKKEFEERKKKRH